MTPTRDVETVPTALLRNAPDAMVLVDPDGRIHYANRQAEALFGYPAADLVGSSVERLLPEPLRDRHRSLRETYLEAPSVRSMASGLDLRAQRADGSTFPAEISLSPVEVGSRQHVLAAVRDVTRQRSAEQSLRDSEERFRLTFESSPVGIALLGLDGTCSSVNPAMCALTGRTSPELVSTALFELLPDRPLPLELGSEPAGRLERELRHADGSSCWVEITVRVVRGADGSPRHLVAHFYDITERRQHQEELRLLAVSDPLTRLPNRTLLLDRTSQALAQLARSAGRCSLYVLDLDRFKTVNDTLGHLAGDELLRQVGRRLTAVARSTDTVARLGGDEFAVLCRDLPGGEGAFSERLLGAFDEDFVIPLQNDGSQQVNIGASIGIAVCAVPGVSASELYREADVALYAAKAGGRGRATMFHPSMRMTATTGADYLVGRPTDPAT